MDDVTEEITENISEPTSTLEVKVVNQPEQKKTEYDDTDDDEYDDLRITDKDIEDFENGV